MLEVAIPSKRGCFSDRELDYQQFNGKESVAIPSKRGCFSDRKNAGRNATPAFWSQSPRSGAVFPTNKREGNHEVVRDCRNPLEAGLSFRPEELHLSRKNPWLVSQSPRSGAVFPTLRKKMDELLGLKSQSPRSGAVFPTDFIVPHDYVRDSGRNPLEAGLSFRLIEIPAAKQPLRLSRNPLEAGLSFRPDCTSAVLAR